MDDDTFYLVYGQCDPWPSMRKMVRILKNGGLKIYIGRYSIRIEDFDHFIFQQYGGDLGEPRVDADSEDKYRLSAETRIISNLLTQAKCRHRFEISAPDGEIIAYFHHNWPQVSAT